MRKITLIITLFLLQSNLFAQNIQITRLGIVNPVPSNLSNVLDLIDRGYLHADSIVIMGIYHKSQTSSIRQTEEFISKGNYSNINLKIIEGSAPLDSLFVENDCSQEFQEIFEQTDALLFFGGADIPPKIYGEETFLTTELISGGKNWELSFLFHLIGGSRNPDYIPMLESRKNYPILGICLGMQKMNVASGGSMYQDIPFFVYHKTTYQQVLNQPIEEQHRNYWDRVDNESDYSFLHFHPIKINSGGFLDFDGIAVNPEVASVHHQAVKEIGKGFNVAATSMDEKIVEALQHERYQNVYGVQFHPDFSFQYEEGREFLVAPGKKIKISSETIRFYQQIWNDFSRRIKDSLQ